MSYSKIPGNAFKMRGLTFRKTSKDSWRAATHWGAVELTATPTGEWSVGFIRHGAYVVYIADKSRLKAFDRVQLALVELAKLEVVE